VNNRISLLAFVVFIAAFEYLFSFNIGGTEVRIFQLVMLSLSYRIFLKKRSFLFFLVLNCFLAYAGYLSATHGYYEQQAYLTKMLFHQELAIITFAVILSYDMNRINMDQILRWNYLGLLLGSFYGMFQYAAYNYLGIYINLSTFDLGEHLRWRVYGFFSEPNMFAIYYAFGVPLVIEYFERRNMPMSMRALYLSPILMALFLSLSRGALLALILIFIYYLYKRYRKVFFMGVAALAPLVLLGLSASYSIEDNEFLYRLTSFDVASDPSSSSRLDVFIAVANYLDSTTGINFKDLMLGHGLGSYRSVVHPFETSYSYFAMNIYIDLLFEHGLLVLGIILFYIIAVTRLNNRYGNQLRYRYVILAVPLFFIMGIFYPLRTVMPFQISFFICISLLYQQLTAPKPLNNGQ
jgi:hypothetical protein